jgi:ketosteroid isomerase-like protein
MSMTTAETVNAFLERLQAGDLDGVGELFAERIDWYVPGEKHLPWAGQRTRRRAFDNPEAMHLQVIDGQIVRMHLYEDTAMVNDAWLDT